MAYQWKNRNILYDDRQIGPYPTDKLKRVDHPTTKYLIDSSKRDRRKATDAIGIQLRMGNYGEHYQKLAQRQTVETPLGAAYMSVQRCLGGMKVNPVASKRAPIPEDPRVLARHIKSLAIFLGADMVGICKVPLSALYTTKASGEPVDESYQYAIVMIVRKQIATLAATDGTENIVDPISFQAYQRLTCITETMANYIRRLGFPASVSNVNNYMTLMPQLILEAGLGEIGRLGIVVNPFIGVNFKSAAVLTNMPLEIDKPIDFGLQDYCEHCRVCSTVCPTHAIPSGGKVEYNGYETWVIDRVKCGKNNMQKCVCGRCAKLCPWGSLDVGPEAYKDWDGSVEWLHERARQRTKELARRGWKDEAEETDKWWFDLIKEDMKSDELFILDDAELLKIKGVPPCEES